MQDRAERAENKAARLVEAKKEFRELASRDIDFARAIYRLRLFALGMTGAATDIEIAAMRNVISFRRPA